MLLYSNPSPSMLGVSPSVADKKSIVTLFDALLLLA